MCAFCAHPVVYYSLISDSETNLSLVAFFSFRETYNSKIYKYKIMRKLIEKQDSGMVVCDNPECTFEFDLKKRLHLN